VKVKKEVNKVNTEGIKKWGKKEDGKMEGEDEDEDEDEGRSKSIYSEPSRTFPRSPPLNPLPVQKIHTLRTCPAASSRSQA